MENNNIIYEQPLSEQVRLCLRLEYLFAQADYYLSKKSKLDVKQIIKTLLKILNITDRPDLKNKLGQTLTQHITVLSKLEKAPDVDKSKLKGMLNKINILMDDLHNNIQKPGQTLRENGFLSALQQRLHVPAGICSFGLPNYHLWLKQDSKIIKKQLLLWFEEFRQIKEVTQIILDLTRKYTDFKEKIKAVNGFYHTNLEATIDHQMIRIGIPKEKKLFSEISVGRHRLAIHFFSVDINGKATQATDDVTFELLKQGSSVPSNIPTWLSL